MDARGPLVALGVAAATVMSAAPAAADDRVCRGALGAISVDDNLRVPAGAVCRLTQTRIGGNILVDEEAALVARGVRVDGNVQSEGARRVVVRDRSFVDGDVQVEDGGAVLVLRSRVEGNIQLEDNRRRIVLQRNFVYGDIQLFSNPAPARIRGNRVDGNLQCKSNVPEPSGGGNRVEGNKEDQCRDL